ncbi:hypothetical protein EVAR_90655_1 [Eumeta japonica]|uniref:Uncharacterized protein n=1 Tax=Eumeta variegata TaxID=151549 RepID=A0A4C1ZDA2_EUMVA|nr:hypothetical protein EVAR_90655_1 [Eumeta japonica]
MKRPDMRSIKFKQVNSARGNSPTSVLSNLRINQRARRRDACQVGASRPTSTERRDQRKTLSSLLCRVRRGRLRVRTFTNTRAHTHTCRIECMDTRNHCVGDLLGRNGSSDGRDGTGELMEGRVGHRDSRILDETHQRKLSLHVRISARARYLTGRAGPFTSPSRHQHGSAPHIKASMT